MEPYKLRHIPSGLFYQPHKHLGSNLSKKGKIYQTKAHGLITSFKKLTSGFSPENISFYIDIAENGQAYKILKKSHNFIKVPHSYNQFRIETYISEWELVTLEKLKSENIEEIVADIRNKLVPITTYFAIKKDLEKSNPDKREKVEEILRETEKYCNISLPKIIEQLQILNNI